MEQFDFINDPPEYSELRDAYLNLCALTPDRQDALDTLGQVLAWAKIGVQSAPRGKTVLNINDAGVTIRAALSAPALTAEEVEKITHLLQSIAKRPDLPNPERDADWKSCQKASSHEAKEALAILQKKGRE